MRLPTVTLRHPTRGIMKVNAYDFGQDIRGYGSKGWKLATERRGDAPDDVVLDAGREAKIQQHRASHPVMQKTLGDADRMMEERRIKREITTEAPEPAPDPAPEPAPDEDAAPAVDPDWESKPWFERRAYVKKITGTDPSNALHAKELMAALQKAD
jgi:hypothetical protein